MKQKLLNSFKLRATLLVAMLCAVCTGAWAEEVTLKTGTNATECTVNDQDAIKVGTSKAGGDMKITVPANTTKLTLHAAAWKGVSGLSLGISGATASPSSITLTADDGISNNSPFTLNGDEEDFVFEITLTGITDVKDITFTSSAKRFVVWGASATTGATTYTVTYNANGGTGTLTDDDSPYDPNATVTVLDNTFTREGYSFDGWNTKADGTGTHYDKDDTFTITSNTTLYAQWINFTVTYDANEGTGTLTDDDSPYLRDAEVTVLGNTFTRAGYFFSGWNTAADGSGTGYAAGATFSIKANTTLYAQWTAYTVTALSNNDSYGTVSVTGFVITGAPAEGYKYADPAYTVSDDATVEQSGNDFTVTPSSNCTVTINFMAIPKYEINWSVNGTIVKTEDVDENKALDFSAPESGVPTGYTFIGWRTSELALTDTNPDDYVTSGTSTANITYYAVLAVEKGGGSATATLTANSSWSSYADKEFTDSEGNKWTANCAGQNSGGTYYYGLKDATSSYVKSPVFSGDITNIVIWAKNGSSKEDRTFYIKSTQAGTSGDLGTVSVPTSTTNEELAATLSGSSFSTFYLGASGALQFTKIVVTYSSTTYSHFCTTVTDVPATVTAAGYATFASELPLDFSSSSIKAYIATVNGKKNGVAFTRVYKVPANTGVLLYKEGGATEVIPVFDGTGAANTDGNVFVPVFVTIDALASTEGDLHNYILNKVGDVIGFYQAAGKKVAAGKAYIQVDKSTSVKGFIALPGFEDETAISAVKVAAEDGVIYNLAGQRVSKAHKGIFIVNGKKVVK